MSTKKLVVLGGGPGGYAAAFLAADKGMDVTLIDAGKKPGGVCLHRGCIPSKALLHIAHLINETKEAKAWVLILVIPRLTLMLFATGRIRSSTKWLRVSSNFANNEKWYSFLEKGNSKILKLSKLMVSPSPSIIAFSLQGRALFNLFKTIHTSSIPLTRSI